MKPLHFIAGKDPLRPALHYIVVRKGFVYVTNAQALIKMPTSEVFGECEFAPDEELAVLASTWQKLGADKAKCIVRKEDNVFALSNGLELKMQTPAQLDMRFPDYDSALPTDKTLKDVRCIGLNPFILADTTKALGLKPDRSGALVIGVGFLGQDRAMLIKHPDLHKNTEVIVMPYVFTADLFAPAESSNAVEDIL